MLFKSITAGQSALASISLFAALSLLPPSSCAQDAVFISEFVADNDGAVLDEDGTDADWIEIYNSSFVAVNLQGWHLTDDAADLGKWTFPATNLPPKGFLLVFASGKDRALPGAPLHTSFNLASGGEYLALVHPDGVTIASQFAPEYPPQHRGFSYGQMQTVTVTPLITSNSLVRVLVPADGSLGSAWKEPEFSHVTWRLGPNGVGYETSVPGFAVHTYKAKTGNLIDTIAKAESLISTPAQQDAVYGENSPVVNYVNTGSGSHYGNDRSVPGFTTGADQEDYALEAVGTVSIPAPGYWSFGVNSDDGFRVTIGSYVVLCDCLRGPGDTVQSFNFPAAGEYPLRLVFFERGGGSEVELYAAQGNYSAWGANFALVGDTASGGLAVSSQPVANNNGVGYRSLIRTDVQSQMANLNASAYIRIPFTVADAAFLASLTLTMRYDDGFVAYLNGTEIARRNAPATPQWNSTATATHSATATEDINLTEQLGLLLTGSNVLAIQGLNVAADDTDFLIQAQLAEYDVAPDTTNYQYYAAPTPGAPNASEPVAGFVADTKFSGDRGFFATPQTVAITSATPNATIYYTLNGSVPSPSNGTVYSAPLTIDQTTTLRAAAYKTGMYASDVDTETYVFLNDVIQQKEGVSPTPEWPAPRARGTGSQTYDYGFDANVLNNSSVSATIIDDLKSLPTFSVVMDLNDLFDPQTGFYANAQGDTIAWERPCSLELIFPDGTPGWQVNCGIRVRGGYSRSADNPKHGFRLFFRNDYGPGKLQYPMFGPTGADAFDKFDLRTFQNYSWSFDGSTLFIALRDIFSRDSQLAMGQPGSRGELYHLYVNGAYWGIYNTDERPEAHFGASYFGGSDTNYNVIKVAPDDGYVIYATDGDMRAWTRLWMAATNGLSSNPDYFRVQGMNPDGTPNPAFENLIDVDNLIDYMLVILYGGNLDAPISNFLGNTAPNNFFAIRDRTGTHGGFRFVAHDSEHTLLDVNANRIGPFAAGDPATGGGLSKSNPQYVWQQMWGNAEFRIKVADHVQKHFFNGGAFTSEAALSRLMSRSNEIYQAVNAESARWGNANHSPALTRTDWLNTLRFVAATFIPQRAPVVLNQLRSVNLFPNVSAPTLSQWGGLVAPGFSLFLTNVNGSGTIYYTTDGSDPRRLGGAVNSTALAYPPNTAIPIQYQTVVRARTLSGGAWSGIVEATFYTSQDFSSLIVSEIMYEPPFFGAVPGEYFEFLELKNTGTSVLDLSGLIFSDGISFTFTNGTRLAPGQFFVLGREPGALASKYPGLTVNGVYTGKLDNAGERIAIAHPLGGTVLSFSYNNRGRWPITAAGFGFSLVPKDPNAGPNPGSPDNWRASTNPGGSPGADDPAPSIPPIVINEILANSAPPEVDSIELYNPSETLADIGGWWLTDDASLPQKYQIPAGTTIPAGGYLVLSETNFNSTPGTNGSFALSSGGEQVYLLSGDSSGNLTGYSHGFNFDASPVGVTIGRYVSASGDEKLELQTANTLGATNAGPVIGPVVIRQIMYHPPDLPGGLDNAADEFIELVNFTSAPVPLFDPAFPTNTWHLRGGVNFDFPTGVTLPANGSLVLANFDPNDPVAVAAFRSRYITLAGASLFGPYGGKLNNDSDTVEIKRPDVPGTNGVQYLRVDQVEYEDHAPWPPAADGGGAVLVRIDPRIIRR